MVWGWEAYCSCLSLPGGIGGTYSDSVLKSQHSSVFAQRCCLCVICSFGRTFAGQDITLMWSGGGKTTGKRGETRAIAKHTSVCGHE